MTMAGLDTTADEARPSFSPHCGRFSTNYGGGRTFALPHLCRVGMSNDFEAAVEEGATLVRVGSALFEGDFP